MIFYDPYIQQNNNSFPTCSLYRNETSMDVNSELNFWLEPKALNPEKVETPPSFPWIDVIFGHHLETQQDIKPVQPSVNRLLQ